MAPWLGWLCWKIGRQPDSQFAVAWRNFRDRYGWLWATRMREQFNRATVHASWPVELRWRGLERKDASVQPAETELLAMLEALLKRFGRDQSPAQ
jgi:hypothetical protein